MLTETALHETIVQLEEAKTLILKGDVPRLRIALLLLDNAVELLLRRSVSDRLQPAAFYYGMLRQFDGMALDAKGQALRDDAAARAVSPKEQGEILRFFQPKLDFLRQRGILSESKAVIIAHFHTYRNEIQHRDKVRRESLRPAAVALFDVACDLLEELPFGTYMSSSTDDGGWLGAYGLSTWWRDPEVTRRTLAGRLRDGLVVDLPALREALSQHLLSRIQEMQDSIGFVAQAGSRLGDTDTTVLKAMQFHQNHPDMPPMSSGDAFDAFKPRYSMRAFPRWADQSRALSRVDDKLEVFVRYARLEQEIEPLELMIDEVASAVDDEIQLQIDIARGK